MLVTLAIGIALLIAFVVIESRVAEPMIRLSLFKIRAFSAGNTATLAAALAQGGLQFMLIIWLQGIWLPLHGYDYADTPLWAGIFLLPLTAGFLVAGPAAGALSDRFGARGIASVGMLLFGLSFVGLLLLPINFPYWAFAMLIALNGIGSGMFAAPNTSAIMGSVLPGERGVVSGMRATFQNSGTALSIGVFFSLMIVGLAHSLPSALTSGLAGPRCAARGGGDRWRRCRRCRRCSRRCSASIRWNTCSAPSGVLTHLPAANVDVITGREFFPNLISGPFHHGLTVVFGVSIGLALLAGIASLARGRVERRRLSRSGTPRARGQRYVAADGVEAGHDFRGQLNVAHRDVLFQVRDRPGAGDEQGVRRVRQQPSQADLCGRHADLVGGGQDHRIVGDRRQHRKGRPERKVRDPRNALGHTEIQRRFLRAIKQAVRVLHADDAGGQRASHHIGGNRADSDRADLALVAQRDHLGQLVVEADDLIAFGGQARTEVETPKVHHRHAVEAKLREVGFDRRPQLGGLLGCAQRHGARGRGPRRADLAHDDEIVRIGRQALFWIRRLTSPPA